MSHVPLCPVPSSASRGANVLAPIPSKEFVPCLRTVRSVHLVTLFALTVSGTAAAQNAVAPAKAAIPPMAATAVSRPPVIDGSLDDEAWAGPPLPTGEWKSYNPLYGDTIPQHTTVWAAYDKDALYFAFRCDDPDPSGIKTSITRRDNIWSDDWVGLSLDALGTGQTSYHLMVNPSGIQLDMINTISGNEDTSPDWVWESAGRVTDRGYVVEIKLPLQTIRFKGGPRSGWAFSSGAASAASACRSRGRRSKPASGCSRRTRR